MQEGRGGGAVVLAAGVWGGEEEWVEGEQGWRDEGGGDGRGGAVLVSFPHVFFPLYSFFPFFFFFFDAMFPVLFFVLLRLTFFCQFNIDV